MPDLTTIPANMQGWVTIIMLALLVAQKFWPNLFPSVPTTPKPTDPNAPVVVAPVVAPVVERPLLELLIKILPVALPLLLAKEAEEKAAAEKKA